MPEFEATVGPLDETFQSSTTVMTRVPLRCRFETIIVNPQLPIRVLTGEMNVEWGVRFPLWHPSDLIGAVTGA